MSDSSYFYLPFLKKEKLASDTYSFYFKRTGVERNFVAGQYFELKLDIRNPDERGDDRVFTVCSSPTEKDYFMFTTRIIQSSFKKTLVKLKPGQKVRFDGPWDDLNFEEKDNIPKAFLAGGIGITPFHSIIKYSLDKKIDQDVKLFVSWSDRKEMIFHEFFNEAQKKLKNFIYIPTITHTDELGDWKGETGRIDKEMLKRHIENIKKQSYYIAGPQPFVKAEKELLKSLGVSEQKITAEDFEGY